MQAGTRTIRPCPHQGLLTTDALALDDDAAAVAGSAHVWLALLGRLAVLRAACVEGRQGLGQRPLRGRLTSCARSTRPEEQRALLEAPTQ